MKKILLSMVLTFFMVVSLFPAVSTSAAAIGGTSGEEESETVNPLTEGVTIENGKSYTVSNKDELNAFASIVNDGQTCEGAIIKLLNDIVLNPGTFNSEGKYTPTDSENVIFWIPIGTNSNPFKGTFDGAGHTVSGIYIYDPEADDQGFFGYVESCTIKNVGVIDSYIIGNNRVGGILGDNCSSGATITNCYNTGTVSGAGSYVGGVAGNTTGSVTNCYNAGTITGKGPDSCDVGGVVGEINKGTVTNSYNTGTVNAVRLVGGIAGENFASSILNCDNTGAIYGNYDSDYIVNVGGIVGFNSNGATVTKCRNTGAISGTGRKIGGLVGGNDNATIIDCNNTGCITGSNSKDMFIGGVAGYIDGAVINCSNLGSIRGNKYIGGIVGWLTSSGESNTTVQDCYNAGIVSSTITTCTECDIGGIVGWLTSSGERTTIVQNCYNAGYISAGAGTTMGGIAGKIGSTNCTVEKCCNSGNICGNSVRGNIAGTNNGTIAECYYDKQMDFRPDKGIYPAKDEIGKYEGKLTTKMIGDELENILGTENWRYAEGMYPRLENVADTDTATVYATPIFLNENDTTNIITKDFMVSTQNDVVWSSNRPDVIKIDGEKASVIKSGNVISQALKATLNGVTKTVWVWKTENLTPVYYLEPTAHSETIHGVHTEINYPNGRYFHNGDKVTVQIKISTDGTITKTGTFVLDVHTRDEEIEFTGQKHIELPVVKGETMEVKTYEYTFTMPDKNVNLYYDSDLNLPKYETPIFVSNTVAKTSEEQTAVTFTLTKDFGTKCEWYPVKLDEEGNLQLDDRIQVKVDGVKLTIASANGEAIQPCDYQIVVLDEENEDLDFSELVTLTVGPYVETPKPVASTGTSKRRSRGTDIVVNGKKKEVGDVKTETHNGNKTTTVTVDGEKLIAVLKEEKHGVTVVIPIKSNSDVATGSLNGQMLKDMEANEATLKIETKSANYTLPASEIDIDQISQQYGESVTLSDIDVEISIAEPSDETVTVVENAAKTGDFSIVCPAVDFAINCSYKGKTTPVSNFNSYVERMVAVPAGIDPNKITTGIVVHPDGTTHHVPTHITLIDGIYYAKINSLTNSTYTVVYNPVEFSDVTSHWAKDAINDMGSRMVVSGIGDNQYAPDRDMTRAEFTAILVRALGLDTGLGQEMFPDVNEADWYCGSVETAVSYGLIKGYHDGTFGADDKITREQAVVIIVRAMKKTGLNLQLSEEEVTELLSKYSDVASMAAYAKTSIATCIEAGIIKGAGTGVLATKEKISRAEVAVMIQRLLQKSELI